jgi:hypothetical protein
MIKLIRNKIKEIVTSFKCLHKISYTLGAINSSHIPIIAPNILLLERFSFHIDSMNYRYKV